MNDLMDKDKDDESLQKYKAALLESKSQAIEPDNPLKCIVKSLDMTDTQGKAIKQLNPKDPTECKKPYQVKEKQVVTPKLSFYVQHDVVLGLKLVTAIYRKGIRVRKETTMV